MTHSYLWLIHICDSFVSVTNSCLWLIHICGIRCIHLRRDASEFVTFSYLWLIHICDSFIFVTHSCWWLIHMCDMDCIHLRRDSFVIWYVRQCRFGFFMFHICMSRVPKIWMSHVLALRRIWTTHVLGLRRD